MVSVAGCLGYDVLDYKTSPNFTLSGVSVAGCLGYDVLESWQKKSLNLFSFSCWLFRL